MLLYRVTGILRTNLEHIFHAEQQVLGSISHRDCRSLMLNETQSVLPAHVIKIAMYCDMELPM